MVKFEYPWIVEEQTDRLILKFAPQSLKQLGTINFIDLPNVGAHLKRGMPSVEIEAQNWVGTSKIPVNGVVSAVNQSVAGFPIQKISGNDWILQLKKE